MKTEKQVPLARPAAQPAPQTGEKNPQVQARGAQAKKEPAKRFDQRKWLLLLALVFFLFSIIFIVPVNSLPGLRNLVWWMGFSAQDTQSMSFGHALLAWAGEGTHRLSSKYRSDKEISIFDREKALAFNPDGPQSALFDAGAVNADRRKRGLGPEGLYGAYNGQDNRRAALNRKVNDLSQEARQNEAEKNTQEVYFGTDADLMHRAAQEAAMRKGVLDGAKLLPKGAVVGAMASDWFSLAVDKASKLSNEQLDKAFGVSTTAAPLSNLNANIGVGEKPKRDLAQVWLMSKASNRAKQLMLKKQLAVAGYVGMEMPKKVYDSLGENSGVMMSGEEMIKDLNDAQTQLLNEEQCRKMGDQANSNISAKLDQSRELVSTITSTVPKGCDSAGIVSWNQTLIAVRENCNSVKETLNNMSQNCGTIELKKEGRCETARLDTYAEDLTGACSELAAIKAENAAILAEGGTPDYSKEEEAQAKVEEVVEMLTDEEVFNTFNISGSGKGESGSGDFFPEIEGKLNL